MRLTTLAAAALGCLVIAAPASADSIAYVKSGNVFKATPDGTRQVQLTTGGGAFSVSQADNGAMVALTGRETLARLAPDGKVLGEIPTYVSDGQKTGTGVDTFGGPFDPQLSPDGSKVAFEWYNTTYGASTGCTESSFPPCYTYRSSKGVGITYADRYTAPQEFGLLTGWSYPQWLDGATLMRSFAGVGFNEDAVFNTLTPGTDNNTGDLRRWFHDTEARDMVDMQLSPDRSSVVGVGGDSDELLRFYRVLEDPLARDGGSVERCWQLTDPAGGAFKDPTYSPDGTRVAYADADGVHVVVLGDTRSGCPHDLAPSLLIAGASSPDWGPADVPAAKQKKAKAKRPRAGKRHG